MKALCTLLAFLLLAASAPAATNTLYTTTTNKVLAITATGKSVIEATNAAAARTALSITNATGLEATAANLTTVSNSVTMLQTQLPGYATNLGALATNFTAYGLTINTGSTNNSLTASRAIVTDANKGVVSSTVTGTELGYVSGVTSALQTQLDAKATAANLTTVSNTVTSHANTLATNTALLNGTNTFTGPNTFATYPIIGTNYSPAVPRVLLATNVGFFPVITNEYAAQSVMLTNDGLKKLTLLFDVRLPAVGPDERVGFYQVLECTNVNKTAFFYQFYAGENTNYITGYNVGSANGVIGGVSGSWIRSFPSTTPSLLFVNAGSATNQYLQGSFPNTNSWGAGLTPLNLVDTSTNGWRMMLGACHDGSTLSVLGTNLNIVRFVVVALPGL